MNKEEEFLEWFMDYFKQHCIKFIWNEVDDFSVLQTRELIKLRCE